MLPFVSIWAAVGLIVPLVFLLLDRFAGSTVNAFPYAMLFLARPTCFMMWMVSSDWLGAGVFGLSVAVNCVLYAGLALGAEKSGEELICGEPPNSTVQRTEGAADRERWAQLGSR